MANDPYKVLGIDRTATDEEVKKAYRELARKYHPDNYANTPLADLAEEKMKEVNEAYETIRRMRKDDHRDTVSDSPDGEPYRGEYRSGPSRFSEIRSYIESNNFYEAEIRLNSVPASERTAEWYYLKGVVFRARGWYFEAAKYFEAALHLDPGNREYTVALESIRNYTSAGTRAQREDTVCNLCCGLLALDCCCECCGGDLISCC
jgi:curved DNA-binding protein CbpA